VSPLKMSICARFADNNVAPRHDDWELNCRLDLVMSSPPRSVFDGTTVERDGIL